MRRVILPMIVMMLGASAARAQDNTISVVHPDGSVAVLEMPAPETAQSSSEPTVAPEVAPEPAPLLPAEEATPPVVPKPSVKPQNKIEPIAAESEGRIPVPPSAAPIAPGAQITREMAIDIAIREAPPVSSVNAFPRSYQGRGVFVVVVKTDKGEYDVLVDRLTGEVINP